MKEIGRCGRKAVAGEFWPQTGLAYLAAVASSKGHIVRIIDGMVGSIAVKEMMSLIESFCPELIVIITTTPTFNNDTNIVKIIKGRFNLVVGFVGTHVSSLPEESLMVSQADFVFVNECEETLVELINNLDEYWGGIKGLSFRDKNGEIRHNIDRPFIEDLDSLPYPARDLLPNQKYRIPFTKGNPFATIIPSRGCPFHCIFCRAGKVWNKAVRYRSPANVFEEIEILVNKYDIKDFAFMTDSFTMNRSWAMELCEKICINGLDVRWFCNSRVDSIDREMLELMKRAGCVLVSYGIESGDQSILDNSRKQITLEESVKAIRFTNEAGIISFAYFIFGLPGETHDTINKTIKFAKTLNARYVNFHIATPFPGTEFYDMAKKKNWLVSSNWDDYEEEGSAVIQTEVLSPDELVAAQKMAMRTFYLRPGTILNELRSINGINDLVSKLKAVKALIKNF
jgi:radical SAM superfamily enzyme YgiQ (UPF0313 family)